MVFFNGVKSKEDLNKKISERIIELYNSSKSVDIKSYLELDDYSFVHKGFINLDSSVKLLSDSPLKYSMNDVSYIYEFVNKFYESGIDSKWGLVSYIASFLNEYLGDERIVIDKRIESLYALAWENSNDEDEYKNMIESLVIGDFKNMNIATSIERSIIANNLLSFFGMDTFFCMGLVKEDEDEDYLSFNIVNCEDKFLLLDYTNTVINKHGFTCPFRGVITLDEIESMLDSDLTKDFVIDSDTNEKIRNYKVGNIKRKRRKIY